MKLFRDLEATCVHTFLVSRGSQANLDGTKCDVFSFAILALYVATGCAPYRGLSNEQIVIKILSKQRMKILEGFAGEDPDNRVRHAHTYSFEHKSVIVTQRERQRETDRRTYTYSCVLALVTLTSFVGGVNVHCVRGASEAHVESRAGRKTCIWGYYFWVRWHIPWPGKHIRSGVGSKNTWQSTQRIYQYNCTLQSNIRT